MKESIKKVLSIQSHVAYGYAGNKAATFPMQKLGIEVSPIHTVQLSNHTQHNFFKGSFFNTQEIQDIISGLRDNNFLAEHDAILSGYIGNLDIAKVIADTVNEIKTKNPNAIYCCDPVFGDFYDHQCAGTIFATKDHPKIFLEHLLPLADIVTPNLFELSTLTNTTINNYNEIKKSCERLISLTKNKEQIIIVTSTSFNKDNTGISIYQKGEFSYIETKKYGVQKTVSGSGDITAAMFLSYILKGIDIKTALKNITECLDGIFKTTHELDTRELALIQAQEYIK